MRLGRFKNINRKKSEEGSVWLVSYADMMTLLVGFFVLLLSFSKIDHTKYEMMKKKTTELFGGEYVVPFQKLADSLRVVVDKENLGSQVIIEQIPTGAEITFQGALFFESGSIKLNQPAINLLSTLLPVIKETAENFYIEIEGHTDDLPLNKAGIISSNWDLSSLRACRVLLIFESMGFDSKKLKATGWGSIRPKIPNEDDASRSVNRRVVIKIMKDSSGSGS